MPAPCFHLRSLRTLRLLAATLLLVLLIAITNAQQPTTAPLAKRKEDAVLATPSAAKPTPGQNSCLLSAELASKSRVDCTDSLQLSSIVSEQPGTFTTATASGSQTDSDSLSLSSVASTQGSTFASDTATSDSTTEPSSSSSDSAPAATSAPAGSNAAARSTSKPLGIFVVMAHLKRMLTMLHEGADL